MQGNGVPQPSHPRRAQNQGAYPTPSMVARTAATDLYAAAAPRRRGPRGGIWSTPEPPPMGAPTVRLTPRGHGRPLRPPERAAVRWKLGLRAEEGELQHKSPNGPCQPARAAAAGCEGLAPLQRPPHRAIPVTLGWSRGLEAHFPDAPLRQGLPRRTHLIRNLFLGFLREGDLSKPYPSSAALRTVSATVS